MACGSLDCDADSHCEILKRHPEFTGKQVLEKLGSNCLVRSMWVWHVMSQYHCAYSSPTPKMRRKGRRFYSLWRSSELIRRSRAATARRRVSR